MIPLLSIKDLRASFESQKILRGISLDIFSGQLHLILGVNGSGKSTLGKVLMGHPSYTKTNGEIQFLGESFDELSTHERARKGFFLSHQAPPEIDGITVKNLLRASEKAIGKKTPILSFKKNLQENLKETGLKRDFLDREMNVGASGGERKKMEMTSLLTLGARLAFLDEIDSGLDIDALKSIGKSIASFLKDKKNSVILISHSEGILEFLSPDKVHVMCGGRIVSSGGMEIAEKVYKEGYGSFFDCENCLIS
jgi:Fe-S cluster assembly ATP-binding protein